MFFMKYINILRFTLERNAKIKDLNSMSGDTHQVSKFFIPAASNKLNSYFLILILYHGKKFIPTNKILIIFLIF